MRFGVWGLGNIDFTRTRGTENIAKSNIFRTQNGARFPRQPVYSASTLRVLGVGLGLRVSNAMELHGTQELLMTGLVLLLRWLTYISPVREIIGSCK